MYTIIKKNITAGKNDSRSPNRQFGENLAPLLAQVASGIYKLLTLMIWLIQPMNEEIFT